MKTESVFANKAEVGKKYLSKNGVPVKVLTVDEKVTTVEVLSNGHKTLKLDPGTILRPFDSKLIDKDSKMLMNIKDAPAKSTGVVKRLADAKGAKVLTATYKEKEYKAEVKADGFYYGGVRYGSLSKLAEKITGHPTSGPAFWGLRNPSIVKDSVVTSYKITIQNQSVSDDESIKSQDDVVKQCVDLRDKKKEHLLAFFLNARKKVIAKEIISIGTLTASLAHPREIFAPAIGKAAAALILVHNHPSGDPTPSEEDIRLTKRIAQVGQIMGIDLLDHLIIAEKACYSFKSAGTI